MNAWGKHPIHARCATPDPFGISLGTTAGPGVRISCDVAGAAFPLLSATVQSIRNAVLPQVNIQLAKRAAKLRRYDGLESVSLHQTYFGRRCSSADFHFSRNDQFTAVVSRVGFPSNPIRSMIPFSKVVQALRNAAAETLLRS